MSVSVKCDACGKAGKLLVTSYDSGLFHVPKGWITGWYDHKPSKYRRGYQACSKKCEKIVMKKKTQQILDGLKKGV